MSNPATPAERDALYSALLQERWGSPQASKQSSKPATFDPVRSTWWMSYGSCNGLGDLMDATTGPQAQRALSVCRHCPVMRECRAWARSQPEYAGVAGGEIYRPRAAEPITGSVA